MNESKTPRTDAELRFLEERTGGSPLVTYTFARHLETELAAANDEITWLKVDIKVWIDNAKALQAQVNTWEPERQKDKSKIVTLTAERNALKSKLEVET